MKKNKKNKAAAIFFGPSFCLYVFLWVREAAKKVFFFSGQSTKRGERVRGCPLIKKRALFYVVVFFVFFLAVLVTTKPRGS